MMSVVFRRLRLAFLGLLLAVGGASAQDLPGTADSGGLLDSLGVPPRNAAPGVGPWTRTAEADLRLIAARTATGSGESVRIGLQFDLKPGWKVYWRSPGDAGYPPNVDWSNSTNLAETRTDWPAPHRFEVLGIQTAGYKEQVVLPVTVRLTHPGKALFLRGSVDYLICSEVCVPGSATVSLDLPPGAGAPAPEAQLIERYAAQVPGPDRGIMLTEATVDPAGREDAGPAIAPTIAPTIAVAVTATPPLRQPDLFVEGPLFAGTADAGRGIVSGPATATLSADGRTAILRAPLVQAYDGPLPALTVTVTDAGRGLETVVTPGSGPLTTRIADARAVPDGTGRGIRGLALMLGLAVLGGLILNLMPCVLPVLSLKVMAFMGHGGGERRAARTAFLASSAGILAAFLALAAALIALKAAGAAVGWGIQFQQPWFLTAMVLLLTLFAANLWGLFEVPLPGVLSTAGGRLGAPRSLLGHFAAGAFATLLATPCSAPFLGTAVGFALARGPGEIAAIFAALGLGMALPYLAIAAVPAVATRLPRPGPWMIRFKQAMGLLLAGTAVWLLTVLQAQIGVVGVAVLAALMAALVGLFALRHRLGGGRRLAATLAVVAIMAGSFAVPAQDAIPPTDDTTAAAGTDWQRFDQTAIAALVAEGKTVFVDVTADWCITCKVNKAAVVDRDPVASALAGPEVVPMQADWTRPDDTIAAYLAHFNRYGIPFNAVYGPGAPDGLPLPELLTDAAVLNALAEAAGRPVR